MQESEPIQNLVDDAQSCVGGRGRLKPVGQILNRFGETEIDRAQAEHQRESEAPEADHAVQVPGPAPPYTARQRQAATPCLAPRPPDDQTSHGSRQQGERAPSVDFPSAWSG